MGSEPGCHTDLSDLRPVSSNLLTRSEIHPLGRCCCLLPAIHERMLGVAHSRSRIRHARRGMHGRVIIRCNRPEMELHGRSYRRSVPPVRVGALSAARSFPA